MFRGAFKVTLDSKGRVAIPTRFRDRLSARCEGQLVVTVDQDQCLLVYPLPDWEETQRKLDRLPSFNKRARQTQRLMVGYATDVELDGQGRILLSKALCEFAELEKHAMLIGQSNKFELWDEERWNQQRDAWQSAEDSGGDGDPPAFETLTL
jgi:MraZ protein